MNRTMTSAGRLDLFVSTRAGGLVAVYNDGLTWVKRPGEQWKVWRRKHDEVALDDWRQNAEKRIAELREKAPWRFQVRENDLPSLRKLERWLDDGVCKTVTGHRVEPDGWGPDGAPSWLIALGFI